MRVLVCEPDPDVRQLLELAVTRFGHQPVTADAAPDVVLMEPSCEVARSVLQRFTRRVPPVVCVSIHPREAGYAPPETVAYLMKPLKAARLAAALAGILAP
jgi:DNA-binding response OmpR family regulator